MGKLKLISFATVVLVWSGMTAQSHKRLVKAIARKTPWKKESIEIGSVNVVHQRLSSDDRIRKLNSQIGMPKGFGQVVTIPTSAKTYWYVVYYANGIPFGMCFDKYYRAQWKKPKLL